jgi:kynurenine 3-monooxygenase
MQEKITIIGAGLVGSLLTCLLAERGYKIELFEKRADPRNKSLNAGKSINLALSDRGLRALQLVDLKKEVSEHLIPMKGRLMHNQAEELTFQPYGKEGQAINSVSRSGLNLALLEKADSYENVEIIFNQKCLNVDLENTSAKFKSYETKEIIETDGDWIIGSDGAFSSVRFAMQKTNRFNYEQNFIEHGYKELEIPATESGDFAMDKNALHIWPRKSFMLIALPNPDKSFTCTLFLAYEGEESFENLKTPEQINSFFKTEFPDAFKLIPDLLEQFQQNPTSSLVTIKCKPWLRNKTLIMGDASHAIVPFYGQGMNSGFEDCRIFVEMLDENEGNWKKTTEQFNETRIKDANAIADLALSQAIPDQWMPLYSMVTFSHTPYSEALEIGKKQDEIMAEIMKNKKLIENWETVDWKKVMIDYI